VTTTAAAARSDRGHRLRVSLLGVVATLAGMGAIVGAMAGCAALFLGLLVSPGLFGVHEPGGYALAAIIGATFGTIAAPLFGWFVLRYIPLGRAIGWTTTGTILGGATGWVSHLIEPTIAAMIGFLIACALVRRWPSEARHSTSPWWPTSMFDR
jgi:hypothetical protein